MYDQAMLAVNRSNQRPYQPPQPYSTMSNKRKIEATEPEPAEPVAALEDAIYDGGVQFRIVHTEPVDTNGPATPELCVGAACANRCKGRPLVVARCESLDDYDAIVALPAVRGCVVGQFSNGFFALVFKHPNHEFSTRECYAISKCRITPTIVRQSFELFTSTTHRGDVELNEVVIGNHRDTEIPLFEEAVDALGEITIGEFNGLVGNAKRAKTMKSTTPLHKAILCYGPELTTHIKSREDSKPMIFDVRKPGPHFLDNFDREKIKALRGLTADRGADGKYIKIREVDIKDAMYNSAGVGKAALYLNKTIIFLGISAAGKTEFIHGLAREICKRAQKDFYGNSNALCPYGVMTKNGRTADLGAVC